jgi:hypothetical protein
MCLSGRVKNAYEWFKRREGELEHQAKTNNGKLKRHDWWRCHYYKYPYLLLETDDAIGERFVDVFSNCVDITATGQITPTPMMRNEGRFTIIFTELLEETNWRQILTRDLVTNATAQIHSYFDRRTPIGVRMFGDRTHVEDEWLVKYSKRQYIDEMYRFGRIRIAPASEYAKGSHIKAVRDLETARRFKLKALSDVLRGQNEVSWEGNKIPICNGVVPLEFMMDDYYLFSTCTEIDRRMPTDFEADAALIIKDRGTFIELLRQALLNRHKSWEFLEREIYYYDPYNDIPCDRNQEFWKHFAYAYQKEHRCVLRARYSMDNRVRLSPFFVELGSLAHISEVVVAP